jgi:class 3 adenylate cyclase
VPGGEGSLSVDPLSTFLPLELLGRLHGAEGRRPAEVSFPAAVLFVDVSRYTSLLEQLVQRGPQGLEQVPMLLERSYASCIEQVHDLGGEVLQFAGDALMAYWPGDRGRLKGAVAAATAAAKNICANGSSRTAAGETGLHVGVGAGTLWAAAIGGHTHWSLLVAGDALREAAAAQVSARRWHFALSASAEAALVGAHPETEPRAGDVPFTRPDSTWLGGFLPVELRAGKAPDEESIRPVTVLFAKIRGMEGGEPDTLARHHSLCRQLQGVLQAHDGPAGQLVFDDKGLVFTAVFGAPGSFHRDDAARAVEAALAIQHEVRGRHGSSAIGIGTGDVLFRVVGGARRRQLMVLGAPMNRAARLMTAATDGVFCDAASERAGRARFDFESVGAVQLAGLGQPEAAYRPLRARASSETRAPLIGRKSELDLLSKAFDEADAGQRRLVVISGEPGIGKSRLVDVFIDGLRARNTTVAVARAERNDRQTSFLPWRRLLADILKIPATAEPAALLAAVTSRLDPEAPLRARLPLLGDVLGIPTDETESTRHLDGMHRADAAMRLFGELLHALAPRPLVMVLEDSQWLDSASWRRLEAVLSVLPRLLVVVCVRAGEAPEGLVGLRQRAEARIDVGPQDKAGGDPDPGHWLRTLDLEDLDDESMRALVLRTLEGAHADDQLARRIVQLARGNPFFAEEIALTLKNKGLITVRDGVWRPIQSLEALRHFDAVEGVIRERIDRLDQDAQRVLKAAAVAGRSFTFEAVRGVVGSEMDADVIRAALETLQAASLVRHAPDRRGYQFRHDQTRDVVHGSIPADLCRSLHARLAEWLESAQVAESAADIAVLVQHFEAAGDKAKTVKYADRAVGQVLRTGAFREAEAFLNICLKHEPSSPPDHQAALNSIRHRRQLGEAHYGLGRLGAQSMAVQRALALAGHSIPTAPLAVATRMMRVVGRLLVQQLSPRLFARASRGAARELQLETARCLAQAAVGDYFEQRILSCLTHTVSAVNFAERVGPTSDLVRAYAQLACSLRIAGVSRGATHFEARAQRTATAVGDPAVLAYAVMLEGLSHIGHGAWAIVEQRLGQSQDLALSAGDQITWCNAQAVRFWSHHYRGDHPEAERAANALLARAQESGNLQQELWALRCKAVCALSMDRPREACDLLRVMTTAMAASTDRAEVVGAKGYLALALTRTGAHDEGIRLAAEVLAITRRMSRPTVHSVLGGISGVAEVLLRGRQAGLSREYAQWPQWERSALAILDRYRRQFPIGASRYALWSGVADWLDGRSRRAVAKWKEGLKTAQRLTLKQDEAMLAAELRRHDG